MKPRKLFIFRTLKSNKCGLVRAYTLNEAIDLLTKHIKEDVEIYRSPASFNIFVPPWI